MILSYIILTKHELTEVRVVKYFVSVFLYILVLVVTALCRRCLYGALKLKYGDGA